MHRWNEAGDPRASSRSHREPGFDRWVDRTRLYLKSRTADHWVMFVAGLVIGALIA